MLLSSMHSYLTLRVLVLRSFLTAKDIGSLELTCETHGEQNKDILWNETTQGPHARTNYNAYWLFQCDTSCSV